MAQVGAGGGFASLRIEGPGFGTRVLFGVLVLASSRIYSEEEP